MSDIPDITPDNDLANATPEEIMHGSQEYFKYLEECDSMDCVYTFEALMKGSVMLYDFRNIKGGEDGESSRV